MKFKIIKRIINGVLVVLVIFFGSQYINSKFHKPEVRQVYQKEIDKKLVISKLHNKSNLVTLKGDIHKKYGKQDSWFRTGLKWFDQMGDREYIINLNGTYEMGIDLNEINEDDISVFKNEISINLPNVKLLNVNLPYEQMKIKDDEGVFRNEYSSSEKKKIYSAAKKEIVKELESDVVSKEKALDNAEEVLSSLLVGVDKGYKVKFVN